MEGVGGKGGGRDGGEGNGGVGEEGEEERSVQRRVQLAGVYYGAGVGAWRGPLALWKEARGMVGLENLTMAECKAFLASQPVYTQYKPARRNYPRNSITVNAVGEVVQIDIADLQKYAASNDGQKYVLLAYDSYSRYLQAVPMLSRKPWSVEKALDILLEGPIGFSSIFWDKEGSFLSKKIQHHLAQLGIHNYTTKSVVKAPGVERSIRTIRTALQRFFDYSGTQRWLEFLPTFIHSYNQRSHSSTKHSPNQLITDPTIILPPLTSNSAGKGVRKRGREPKRTKWDLPAIGSYVRLNRLRSIFDKEASGSYTEEVFQVTSHKTGSEDRIPMITVSDLLGEPVLGSLYPQEYQAVQFDPSAAQVDRVLQTRRLPNHQLQNHVTLQGYPTKYKLWIDAA